MKQNKKFDMIRFLDDFYISHNPYSNISTQGFTATHCPYCGEDEYMGCAIDSLFFTCWGCNGPRNPYDVLSKLTGEYDVKPILKKYGGYISNHTHVFNNEKENRIVPTKIEIPSSGDWNKNLKAWDYLENERGFNPQVLIPKYKLTYTTFGFGAFSYRIIIPFFQNGRCVTLQGRSYVGDELRYRALASKDEIVNIKETFYNIDNTVEGGNVLLVEGVMDVWRLSSARSVIASCGITMSKRQLRILQERFSNIFIMFDGGEEEAQQKAEEACYTLNSGRCNAEVVSLGGQAGDPDEVLRGKEDEIIHIAKELKLY